MKPKPLDSPIIAPRLRVVGYVRGSTDEQQNTLAAQRAQIEAYCAYKQFDLAEVFVDEGASAMDLDFYERPVAARIVAWMQEHGATAIVITKLDRGFRGAVDLLLTIDSLRGHGIGIHLLDIGLDPTTPVGEMVATILAAVAHFECRRRSERQVEAFQTMRATGQRSGAVPYGWDAVTSTRVSKTGRQADNLVVNAVEYPWLLQILAWHKAGRTDWDIARALNEAGVRTKNAGATRTYRKKSYTVDGRWKAGHVRSVRLHALLDDRAETTIAKLAALAAA